MRDYLGFASMLFYHLITNEIFKSIHEDGVKFKGASGKHIWITLSVLDSTPAMASIHSVI